MVRANINPGLVVHEVINSIRGYFPEFFVFKIMALYLDRIAFGTISTPCVFVETDQLFFLCIYGNDWLTLGLIICYARRDKLKLIVTIRV